MIDKVKKLVYALMGKDNSGHGIDHIERVLDLSLSFASSLDVDIEIVVLIALLHDVDDYKIVGKEISVLNNARKIMMEADVDSDVMNRVCEEIKRIGFSKRIMGLVPETLEGKIVSDADMCDALGAHAVIRACTFGAVNNRPFFDKNFFPKDSIEPGKYINKEDRTTVEHFFYKILKLKSLMLTEMGRKEAEERHQIVINFLYSYFKEEKAYDWIRFLDEYIKNQKCDIIGTVCKGEYKMSNENNLFLTKYQIFAYWIVNVIKNKRRELFVYGIDNTNEVLFAELFASYSLSDWHKLYLSLSTELEKEEMNSFSIDTVIGGHNELNRLLTKIIEFEIPDINLSKKGNKDSVLSIKGDDVFLWYKSCGEMKLPTEYKADFIISGDLDELNFYNLVVAIIAILELRKKDFHDVNELRRKFCSIYINQNGGELEDVMSRFNEVFDKVADEGLLTGNHNSRMFYSRVKEIDLVGLSSYMNFAKYYVDAIINEKEQDAKTLTKKNEN